MNDSGLATLPTRRLAGKAAASLLLLLLCALSAAAQSQDLGFPTPVSANEISGRIAARDIGDARLTRHYYILAGRPGDLVFTVTSNNLNGDVDLFTAGSLRPMGKISIYAGSQPTSATKTVFLRQHESLILRVEARSANDNEGTYTVRFAGTFEPVAGGPAPPEESLPTLPERTERGVRRVTSSGARIEEPEPETTASSTETRPEESEERTTTTTTTAQPSTAATGAATEAAKPAEPATKPEPVRTARTGRRPRGRRSSRAATPTTQPQPSPPATETTSTATSSAPPTLNPRLIIETRDGMRQERYMSTVRSVTVQNGQIVIVSSNGMRTERISLASVLRMSIEP